MIIYPSGTVFVKKVNGNNDFIEDSLDYFDLEQTLSSNLVTITGAQTVSGQKSFIQPVIAPAVESISGGLDLKASGTNTVDIYTNGILHFSIDAQGKSLTKTHENFTGSESIVVTSGIQTTNDVDAVILSIPIEDNSAYWIELYAIGRRTDGGSPIRVRMENLQAAVYRQGGAAIRVGNNNIVLTRSENANVYEVEMNTNGNNFEVTVNGSTAETVNWVCSVRYQRVSLNT